MFMNFVFKSLLFTLGCISLLLGLIGIILPLLPTTPFVLLSSWCFFKSSKRAQNWLLNDSIFSTFILSWQNHKAITKSNKRKIICFMILSFAISIIFVPNFYLKGVLFIMALLMILFISYKVQTLDERKK